MTKFLPVYLTILSLVCLGKAQDIGDHCAGPPGDDRIYAYHGYRRICCLDRTCDAGEYAVTCTEEDPSSTQCKPCDGDNYMDISTSSSYLTPCIAKRKCLPPEKIKDDGSKTKDRECSCMVEIGYWGEDGYCDGPQSCPSGQELHLDGKCQNCKKETFKAGNGMQRCIPWTRCEAIGLKTVKHGSNVADVTCTIINDTGVVNETTTDNSKASAADSTDNTDTILMAVLIPIAIILIILIILVVVFLCKRRTKKRQSRKIAQPSSVVLVESSLTKPSSEQLVNGSRTSNITITTGTGPNEPLRQTEPTQKKHDDIVLEINDVHPDADQLQPLLDSNRNHNQGGNDSLDNQEPTTSAQNRPYRSIQDIPESELTPEDLRRVCMDGEVKLKWKVLMGRLNLTPGDCVDVENKQGHSTEACIYEVLERWRERRGKNATRKCLAVALSRCNLDWNLVSQAEIEPSRQENAELLDTINAISEETDVSHDVMRKVSANGELKKIYNIFMGQLGLDQAVWIELENKHGHVNDAFIYDCLSRWKNHKAKEANLRTLALATLQCRLVKLTETIVAYAEDNGATNDD